MVRPMLLIALALAAGPAVAQSQGQLNDIADADYRKSDAAMTRQWRTTYARMKALDSADHSRGGGFGYAAALLESQRAWLKFRSTECVLEGGQFAGGSMQGMIATQCETFLTDDRTKQLHDLEWRERLQ